MPGIAAPSKVNLRLAVLAREESGYHQIETVFCALELADELTVQRSPGGLTLDVRGARLGAVEDNLVHRAARAFFAALGTPPAADIVLEKRIPAGAGLGGGSSDAAATLRALNDLHGTPFDDDALLRIGGTLGSDVPFFLCGSSLALAWGRGDRLLPLQPLPTRAALVVVPPFPVATADAYRDLAAARAQSNTHSQATALAPDCFADWSRIAQLVQNDFEPIVFRRHPELELVRHRLRDSGAYVALLAGSGSALFALFDEPLARDRAALAIARHHDAFRTIPTSTAH